MNFETLVEEKYSFKIKPQQLDAALHTAGPAVLIGAPGSGKTTAVALRCANLIICGGIKPENILNLTYDQTTRKAIEQRYRGIFGNDYPKGLLFSTVDDLCGLVVKEYASLMQIQPPRMIYESKRRILRAIYAGLNSNEYLSDIRLDGLIQSISISRNYMLSGRQIEPTGRAFKDFGSIFAAYDAYMSANNYMDGDGMQARALAAFNDRQDLLERFRKRFHYINVDEAQELSKLQFMILSVLASPRDNLFLAGCSDESLSAGVSECPQCLHDFNRVYPQAKAMAMERNYRSTHAIVEAANRLIRHNVFRNAAGMNTGNEIGLPIDEKNLTDYGMLGGHIVSKLRNITDAEDAAIFYRNDSTAAVIADAMEREGIPFQINGPRPACFDHWVVRDIMAFLALGYNPADIVALKRVYRKLNVYISKEAYAQAVAWMETGEPGCCALDALLNGSKISDGAMQKILKLKSDLAVLPGMRPAEAVNHILKKAGYGNYLKKACGAGLYLENLLLIAENLETIAARTADNHELLGRMAELTKAMEDAGKNAGLKAVTLSTVHAARGEEFKSVFVVDLFEGGFPSLTAIEDQSSGYGALLEDERRLFYTAVTRASKYLELVYSSRINGGRVKPSRFVRELLPIAHPHKAIPGPARKQPVTVLRAQKAPERKPASAALAAVSPAARKAPAHEHFKPEAGLAVEHRLFGHGVVSSYDMNRDILAVRFDKFGVKKFAASYCMNGGFIQKSVANNTADHMEAALGASSPE